ncbi:helix-turn-helix transcriptional regulator [Deinococcus sp. MIMF12]|uniref:Helix-turn-helix transcriptional regulator n=1 Tax=Deinococcus rhizophilus TaxID=3049544 RepID=A0ABT7JKQ0_9DEIO|nr:helix-turn-helix transcriptional regulator [Deinococcus rhizophilus]MDL2344224.1 helix-turn-helix transcriptional regulator [Deinococcus rhizophilus]
MPDIPMTHTFPSREGVTVILHEVPTTLDAETGEVIGFRLDVSRAIEHLVQDAARGQVSGATVERHYEALPRLSVPTPDPVSLELRRVLRERGLTGAEIAERLGIKPPLISRWLSPTYHGHGMETLRRIADALDMDVEVKLKPRENKAAS